MVTNVFGTRKRITLTLQTHVDEFYQTWDQRTRNPSDPKIVDSGPVKEVILKGEEVDLTKLPIPRHFKEEPGYYVTSDITCKTSRYGND